MDSLDGDNEDNFIRDSMGVQSPRPVKYGSRCKKCLGVLSTIFLIIVCIILAGFICFAEGVSGVYFFDWVDGRNRTSYYYPEATELTARSGGAFPRSSSIPKRCSDFYDPEHGDFGCCAIYDYRGLYNISWSRDLKEDENGTNCPTYEQLINNYVEYVNKYLSPVNCTEVECCTMNYAIDRSIRENLTFPDNRLDPEFSIQVPVSRDYYTCRPLNVVMAYERYYRDPSSGPMFIIALIVAIIYLAYKCIAALPR
jgi:hypothetical protein